MTDRWEMEVEEVFNFSGGRTVFVGRVTGAVKFIGSCECVLDCDGRMTRLKIEGEMIPERPVREGLRVVSSTDQLSIDKRAVAGCRLRALTPTR